MRLLARVTVRWWWVILLLWLAVLAFAVSVAPPFADVATYRFVSEDSVAARGQQLIEDGWPEDNFTRAATVVLVRSERPLDEGDRAFAAEITTWLRSDDAPEAVRGVVTPLEDADLAPALVSSDGHALLLVAGMNAEPFTPQVADAVRDIRQQLAQVGPPAGLAAHVTGGAAIAVDEGVAIQESVRRTQLLTVGLVVLLLLWIFRSPFAAIVPLVTVGIGYTVSISVVSLLAQAGMAVSHLYETFAIVIVFGAGTDYSLLLMSRYDEELVLATRAGFAPGRGLRRVTVLAIMAVLGGVMASSAGTTIVGFSAQSVAEFGLFRTMGPALAIAVAITLVAGLTINPALMRAFGRLLFWPDRYSLPRSGSGASLLLRRPAEVGLTRADLEAAEVET